MIIGNITFLERIIPQGVNDICELINKECKHNNLKKYVNILKDAVLFRVWGEDYKKKTGFIGLKNIDLMNRNIEIVVGSAMPQKYTVDAVKTMANYLLNELEFHKVYLFAFESAAKDIKCYEKAGFIKEGVLFEHFFYDCKYENAVLMAKN